MVDAFELGLAWYSNDTAIVLRARGQSISKNIRNKLKAVFTPLNQTIPRSNKRC
eukprot:m.224696 g.224696  ORF g.224696 m.224696 type:complete len:54 (+) comp17296_c0_seq1:3-164(+)